MDAVAIDQAVARILSSWAVILMGGGLPLIYLGDEIAPLSDHSYRGEPLLAADNRWSHRLAFSPEAFEKALSGEGPEGAVLSGLLKLLDLRRRLGVSPSVSPELFSTGDRGTIGFHRGPLSLIANLSRTPAVVDPPARRFDLMRGELWEANVLAPYEYRILSDPES
jgi:amylosucrase